MPATTTQTIHLINCPACRKSIELHATYDVRIDLSADTTATEKTASATLTMTGARVDHRCPPPELHRGGIISPALPNPFTRED